MTQVRLDKAGRPAGATTRIAHDPPAGYGPGYGYGAPNHQPVGCPPYPPAVPPTNTMAILALVMAFVFAPLAVVFGIMARNQIARTGEAGSGMALAGLIIGAIATALGVIYIIVLVIAIGATLTSIPTVSP